MLIIISRICRQLSYQSSSIQYDINPIILVDIAVNIINIVDIDNIDIKYHWLIPMLISRF